MTPSESQHGNVRRLAPRLRYLCLSVVILLAVSACTTPVQQPGARSDDGISDCESLFEALNAIVKAGGVQDGGAAQVKGFPLLYDSIHSCGCYHMFFPTPRARLRPRQPALEEPILVPARLGWRRTSDRVVIRIASGTHSIQNVRYRAGNAVEERRIYDLAKDDELRSLPLPTGGRRSLYRSDGIVPGSQRGERYLYWPMGVRDPGSMRQWGRHATAFVGRRHFDDPTLIEGYFEL